MNRLTHGPGCVKAPTIWAKICILSYRTDGTKEYHLWYFASRIPNPSSLPDRGFEFFFFLLQIVLFNRSTKYTHKSTVQVYKKKGSRNRVIYAKFLYFFGKYVVKI